MTLTSLDLAVIAVPFLLVISSALLMRRYLRSVADYLAANRCAGRFLITAASGETTVGVLTLITGLEVFSKTGFSLTFWNGLTAVVAFLFGMFGLVVYRFRQTRSLTFHQFFEARYSRGVRVLASFLNVFSGLFNFGVAPAVGARFFVYFCGLPEQIPLLGWHVPTFAVIAVILMTLSLVMTLTGGHISIMVTDSVEALVSGFFYIVVALFLVTTISTAEMRDVLLSGKPGQSFIDPFDISKRPDFDGWFVALTLMLYVFQYGRGGWHQTFSAAAKSAHESRMAQILGNWRGYSHTAMIVLVSLGAFVILKHADFATHRAAVDAGLKHIGSTQLQTQMRMPMALGLLLSPGVKGCFCAVALFGLLASQGSQLHWYGSTILQDVILPLRKRVLTQREHVRLLRWSAFGVGAFAVAFSMIYKPMDYLMMITQLIGAIYMGGIGPVVWGGLYWKRGTRQGAMTSLILASTLAIISNLLSQFWPSIVPHLRGWTGPGGFSDYLGNHVDKFPLNGLQLSAIVVLTAAAGYVIVSLLTCREAFDLDSILHRGRYQIEGESHAETSVRRSWLARLVNINSDFTRNDRALAYATLSWTMFWKFLAVGILLWTLFVGRLSPNWWFHYVMISNVWVTLALGVCVTGWFTYGIVRDLLSLLRTLETARRDEADDGTVRAETEPAPELVAAGSTRGG